MPIWSTGRHSPTQKIPKCPPRGVTQHFKWWGWSKSEQKSKPKKSPREQNLKKIAGQKLTPRKSHAEFLNHKNFQKANWLYFFRRSTRQDTRELLPRIFTFFWIPKRKPTSIKTAQKILAKFSYPKNPGIEHFKPQKILQSSLSLEIRSREWRIVSESGKNWRERRGRKELREGSFALSPLSHPIAVFPVHSSLPRPHYLNAWNRLYVMEPCSPFWKT